VNRYVKKNRPAARGRWTRRLPLRPRRSSSRLIPRPMVWGHEEIEVEWRARGFSPACSRSLGRRLDRVAVARSFSAPIRLVVVTSGSSPGRVRGKEASWRPDDAPRPDGQARKAMKTSWQRLEAGLGFVSSRI
jgi:hypothetical protein